MNAVDEGGESPRHAHPPPANQHCADAQLAELLRHLADAVVIADTEGNITFWNDAATTLFGWDGAEALGSRLDLIIPERLRERHWAGYQQTMATGHTSYGERLLEVPALHRDGRGLSIAFTVSLLHEPATAALTGIAAVIRDDTARWQERRQLRREVERLQVEARSGSTAAEGRCGS